MVRLLIDTDRTTEHQPGRLRGELTSQESKKFQTKLLRYFFMSNNKSNLHSICRSVFETR